MLSHVSVLQGKKSFKTFALKWTHSKSKQGLLNWCFNIKYSMKLLCVFCSVQFKRQNLCLVRFMALPQNTARNIFDFMSVHLDVYFIDNVVVVNAACLCYNTCMTTNNLPHQWQSTHNERAFSLPKACMCKSSTSYYTYLFLYKGIFYKTVVYEW